MHDVDALSLYKMAYNPSLRRLSSEVNDEAGSCICQSPGQKLAKPEECLMQRGVLDKIQPVFVVGESLDQFRPVPRMNDEPDVGISSPQKPKVVERDESLAAKPARRVIRDDDDAHE